MFAPLPVYEAAYGGISLFGYWPAPTGSMPVGAQNDTELSRRQSNLESFEGIKILKLLACALRQGFNRVPVDRARAAGAPSVSAFPIPEWIALGCGRR